MYKPALWTYENRLVAILGLCGAVAALDAQALFYLSPYVARDLHLDNTRIGIVSSVVVLTWAVAAFIVGNLSDRRGRRKPYLVGAFVAFGLCSGLSGLAGSFILLLAARALIGFAEGPVIPISQSIMMAESSPARRGLNMGIAQNLGSQLVGSMLGPLIVVYLAERFSWHAAFFIAGIPGLLVALLVALCVREPAIPARESPAAGHGQASFVASALALLRHGNVRACVAISCFVVAFYFLILIFLPLYCVNVLHMSTTRMSYVLGCTGAAAVVSSFAVPMVSDYIGRKPAIALFSLLGVAAPLGALLAGGSMPALMALVFMGSMVPGTTTLFMGTVPMETVPPQQAAAASGLVLGVGQVLGGFLTPALAGVLADRYGLQLPLWIALGALVAAAIACLWLTETAPRVLAARAAALQPDSA
jgi:MFS family permease